jgi:uncharacterized secreted protein with C-terminal beta-propeller domain
MKVRESAVLTASLCLAALSLAASPDTVSRRERSRRVPARRIGPAAPVTRSSALSALQSCDEVRASLVDAAVERVLEYRYGGWFLVPWAGAEDGREVSDVPSDYTTTNTQERGVDELDIVKTNGTHLYAVEGDQLHILQSWPADATSEVATAGAGNQSTGLFLRNDRVLVASQVWEEKSAFPFRIGGTRLELMDVKDPSSPVVLRTVDVEGSLVDARLIDGHLYAVIRSYIELPGELWDLAWRDDLGLPEIPWDVSEDERERDLAEAREILRPFVAEIVDRYPFEDMSPQILDRTPYDPDPAPEPLFDCGSLYRPAQTSDWAFLSILHLDLDQDGPVDAIGLIADGWTVYASATSLYVAQTSNVWAWWWGWMPAEMTTSIHKFELDPSLPEPVRYAASGEVDGWILDQFSMSEFEGYLRVASTEFDWWWGTTPDEEPASSVTVLGDDGRGNLQQVGHVGGLGPGEQIHAVRFIGDKGYVVTFEQIDPLFTIDLGDPATPEVVGELEVTGFSSYLHPIGDDWLLAVGQEADEEGRVLGLAVSIFDVRDFANPVLAHRYLIEGDENSWSWSEALSDHHAFTYHRGVLSIPIYVSGAEGRFSGLLVLAVDPDRGIWELGRVDHQDLGTSNHHAWMRRSVYIEDAIYSLSSAGVKVNSLLNPEVELAKVPFGE